MEGERLPVVSDAAVPLDEILKNGVTEKPDVSALAARSDKRITVLVWHYHDDNIPGADADVILKLGGAPGGTPKVTRTLIDETHSNAFTWWLALGSPQSPTEEQIRDLEKASQLAEVPGETEVSTADGDLEISFTLARQGVTLLELTWP